MENRSSLVGPILRYFFIESLQSQKRVSQKTVNSYRDTFRILLRYVHEKHGIAPESLAISDLTETVILSFLDYLEQERGNSIRSRNARLAAIRSFYRVVALRDPMSVSVASCILAIPVKQTEKRLVRALSREEIDALITAPDLNHWSGRRDHALLLTLYNSGARVSEIIELRQSQVSLASKNHVVLHGKGRKERVVPLWSTTGRALRSWFQEIAELGTDYAFPNSARNKLTREGVNYILQRAKDTACLTCPSLKKKHVTPHTFRHSTATHLLQSGLDIASIALWLGHESIETTHVYVESDLASKETALNKLTPAGCEIPRFKADDSVLSFLATL